MHPSATIIANSVPYAAFKHAGHTARPSLRRCQSSSFFACQETTAAVTAKTLGWVDLCLAAQPLPGFMHKCCLCHQVGVTCTKFHRCISLPLECSEIFPLILCGRCSRCATLLSWPVSWHHLHCCCLLPSWLARSAHSQTQFFTRDPGPSDKPKWSPEPQVLSEKVHQIRLET